MLLLYIVIGLICGFVDSILGMGYGVSTTSVFIAFGLTPALVSASIHTAEGFVDGVSALSHWKFKNVNKGLFLPLVLPGIVGAVLGALFLSWLSLTFAKHLVSGLLFLMGSVIFIRFAKSRVILKGEIPRKMVPLLGFAAAFIDLAGGGGWGPICTPTLILNGLEPRKAIGTVESTEPFISFAGVVTFGLTLGFQVFRWSILLPIMLGGFVLTPIAAYLSRKMPSRFLGLLVGVVLMVLNGRTVLHTLLNAI